MYEKIIDVGKQELRQCFLQFSYNIEQEQKLATETTVLVEQYTVSIYDSDFHIYIIIFPVLSCTVFHYEKLLQFCGCCN